VAPIPTADFAEHHSKLQLLPDVGIASDGRVGSVLLFSEKELDDIRDIAMPTDSSTSRKLLLYLLAKSGHAPESIQMGPDLDEMLQRCDAALLIGDRAIDEAARRPELVKLDLGEEWKRITGYPMVFGVFAATLDAPSEELVRVHTDLLSQLERFEQDEEWRATVVASTAARSEFNVERVETYFREVRNRLDDECRKGLEKFLVEVCGMNEEINWFG
jgi:chorismate dehydratase